MSARVTICIGCGCDDTHACLNAFDEPCGWLTVDRREGRGVCDQCIGQLPRWKAGDRELSVKAANAVKRRAEAAV